MPTYHVTVNVAGSPQRTLPVDADSEAEARDIAVQQVAGDAQVKDVVKL